MNYNSVDSIHNRILNNIDNSYQKTEGFPTYDITRGFAFGLKDVDDLVVDVANKQRVENLEGDELDVLISERTGLTRKTAVKAIGEITIVSGRGVVLNGDLFETENGIQFESIERKEVVEGDTVAIRAVIGGSIGNVPQGAITVIPKTIQGISEVTNTKDTIGGYDIETDTAYRERYYTKLRTPVNGVNANQYKLWAMDIDGVGGARCIPTWNGKNTVKVVIIGSDLKPASQAVIKAVQDYIDPNQNGDGSGVATIGAVTTVVGATEKTLNVTIKGLSVSTGMNIDEIKDTIKENVDLYVRQSVFNTDKVSVAKLGAIIADTKGVLDFTELQVNGGHTSITLEQDECAVLGVITYD